MRLPYCISGVSTRGRKGVGIFFMGQDCDHDYNQFPAITIGGPAGDYTLDCPVLSARWVEYQVVSGAAQVAAQVFVTGGSKPLGRPHHCSKNHNNDTSVVRATYHVL